MAGIALAGCASHSGVVLKVPSEEAQRLQAGSAALPGGELAYRVAPFDALDIDVRAIRGPQQRADYGNEIELGFVLDSDAYRLVAGDVLGLMIDGEGEREQLLPIRPDGYVTLPRLDREVKLDNLTFTEATHLVWRAYSKLIKQPQISLSLQRSSVDQLKLLGGRFTVGRNGAIVIPTLGAFTVRGKTVEEIADGVRSAATQQFRNPVKVFASLAELSSRATDARVGPDGRSYFRGILKVSPEGQLVVPEAGTFAVAGKSLAEVKALIEPSIMAGYVNPVEVHVGFGDIGALVVYVGGEVRVPGRFAYQPSMTLLQLIAAAGWVGETGDLGRVSLLHATGVGEYAVYTTNLREVMEGKSGGFQDLRLSPRDIVFVPRTGVAAANLAIDQYIRRMLPIGASVNYTYVKDSTTSGAVTNSAAP